MTQLLLERTSCAETLHATHAVASLNSRTHPASNACCLNPARDVVRCCSAAAALLLLLQMCLCPLGRFCGSPGL
jgi:hypothetical protein